MHKSTALIIITIILYIFFKINVHSCGRARAGRY